MLEAGFEVLIVCDAPTHPGETRDLNLLRLEEERTDWLPRIRPAAALVPVLKIQGVFGQDLRSEQLPTLAWNVASLQVEDGGRVALSDYKNAAASRQQLDSTDQAIARTFREVVEGSETYAEYLGQVARARFVFECPRCLELSSQLPRRQQRKNRLVVRGERLFPLLDQIAMVGGSPFPISIDALRTRISV